MKVQEILMEAYTAYVLDDASKNILAERFPPKYPEFIGHHITVEFGVPADTDVPVPANIKVIGYKDSGDGLEALVVSVNGSTRRPDGQTYHITWSLDRSKYSPVDSNGLLRADGGRFTLVRTIPISTAPQTLR